MDLCEARQVALEAIRNKALEQQEAGPRFGDENYVFRTRISIEKLQISGDIVLGWKLVYINGLDQWVITPIYHIYINRL